MKRLVKTGLINLILILAFSQADGPIAYGESLGVLLSSVVTLTLIEVLVQPVVSILFTPINLLTLGLLRWLPFCVSLYLLSLTVPEFVVKPLNVPEFSLLIVKVPQLHFGRPSTFAIVAIMAMALRKAIHWTFRPSKSE